MSTILPASFLQSKYKRDALVRVFYKLVSKHAYLFYKFNLYTHPDIYKLSAFVVAD